MRTVKIGDFVKVCYVGRLEGGAVFEETGMCRSAEIRMGAGEVAQGLEDALIGMAQGERKTITLPPDDAYGERDETLEQSIPRLDFARDYQPKEGEFVAVKAPGGQMIPAMVTHVDEEYVRVDFNHPLAGKTLTYELEVEEVNEKPSSSLSQCGSSCCCNEFHAPKVDSVN